MRVFESGCVFNYTWDHVSAANWRKYPNEFTKHVKSVDILRREVDPATGVLRTERLIGCSQPMPRWIGALVGARADTAFVREISEIDPRKKILTMRSQNLNLSNILSVFETVEYRPLNSLQTEFTQSATLTSQLSLQSVCNKIEDFCLCQFSRNAQLGRRAFESVLEQLPWLSEQHE